MVRSNSGCEINDRRISSKYAAVAGVFVTRFKSKKMALFSKITELTLFSYFLLSQLQSSLLYKSGSAWSKMNVGLKTTNCGSICNCIYKSCKAETEIC